MNKVITFSFRLYPHERRVIELMATQDGRKLSEFIRELIRATATQRGLSMAVDTIQDNLQTDKEKIR